MFKLLHIIAIYSALLTLTSFSTSFVTVSKTVKDIDWLNFTDPQFQLNLHNITATTEIPKSNLNQKQISISLFNAKIDSIIEKSLQIGKQWIKANKYFLDDEQYLQLHKMFDQVYTHHVELVNAQDRMFGPQKVDLAVNVSKIQILPKLKQIISLADQLRRDTETFQRALRSAFRYGSDDYDDEQTVTELPLSPDQLSSWIPLEAENEIALHDRSIAETDPHIQSSIFHRFAQKHGLSFFQNFLLCIKWIIAIVILVIGTSVAYYYFSIVPRRNRCSTDDAKVVESSKPHAASTSAKMDEKKAINEVVLALGNNLLKSLKSRNDDNVAGIAKSNPNVHKLSDQPVPKKLHPDSLELRISLD